MQLLEMLSGCLIVTCCILYIYTLSDSSTHEKNNIHRSPFNTLESRVGYKDLKNYSTILKKVWYKTLKCKIVLKFTKNPRKNSLIPKFCSISISHKTQNQQNSNLNFSRVINTEGTNCSSLTIVNTKKKTEKFKKKKANFLLRLRQNFLDSNLINFNTF